MFDFQYETPAAQARSIPFFEAARSDVAPGYRTRKDDKTLKLEIAGILSRMGGGGVQFRNVVFSAKPRRYGYEITFFLMSARDEALPCRMFVAALPLQSETETKKQAALAQALFMFRDYLQGEYNSLVFRPDATPLAQYLVLPSGKTLVEEIASRQNLLPEGSGR